MVRTLSARDEKPSTDLRGMKGDDLEFISISLDKREKDWRRMLEVENLPWVMLWNKEGFTIGDEPNTIQKAYGFYSIPFIVLHR